MNEQTKLELLELLKDLGKICEAAANGSVEAWRNEKGDVVSTIPYTMSGNAYVDVCGVEQNLRMILVRNNITIPD